MEIGDIFYVYGNIHVYNRYIYIWYVQDTSSAGLALRNVGGVKYQSFLKRSNHW